MGAAMSIPRDKELDNQSVNEGYQLRDADDNHGIVPDDALQKVNPAEAERLTTDHDPHHIAKDNRQYDSELTKSDK